MRQTIIELNWRTRPIRKPKILKGHDEHVITCLQFYGNRIVSGSDDNTLKVWSAITGKVSNYLFNLLKSFFILFPIVWCGSACAIWSDTLVAFGRLKCPVTRSFPAVPIER